MNDSESGWGWLGAMVPFAPLVAALALVGLNVLAVAGFAVLVAALCWAVCREPAPSCDDEEAAEAKHAEMADRWETG